MSGEQVLGEQYANTMSQTESVRTAATNKLKILEKHPGFGVTTLKLLTYQSANAAVRQAAAIYFKNFIKREWVS